MSNFDYYNFNDGDHDIEFVVHAKKYTKQQAIELCVTENDYMFDINYCNEPLRKPTEADIKERSVRWYVHAPVSCGRDDNTGCYSYCPKGEKGSFRVWVIVFEDLKERENNA